MIFDKIITAKTRQDNIYTNISGSLRTASGAFMYFATLDPASSVLSTRTNLYVKGPKEEEVVAYEPRIAAPTTSTSQIKCDYKDGDIFYYNTNITNTVKILVTNLKVEGRSIILKLKLSTGATIQFGSNTNVLSIATGSDYVSGTYFFVFTNINGVVELTNFFRGAGHTQAVNAQS